MPKVLIAVGKKFFQWVLQNPKKLAWLLTVFAYAMFFIYEAIPYGAMITILLAALAALIALHDIRYLYAPPPFFFVHILVFAVFSLLSALWAWNPRYAVEDGMSLMKTFLCIALLYAYCSQETSVEPLLKAIVCGGYVVCVCVVMHYGPETMASILLADDRIGNEYINANTLGLLAAVSVLLHIHFILLRQTVRWTDLFLILGLLMIAISGSKKAVLFLAAGCFLLIAWKSLEKGPKYFWMAVGLFAVGVIALLALPIFDNIRTRMLAMVKTLLGISASTGNSTALRIRFIEAGLSQFMQTPILGIGMGSTNVLMEMQLGYEMYLHNNYVELLAAGGIVGFVCYYSIHAYLLYSMIKYWSLRDHTYTIIMILMVLLLAVDFAMVSYYLKETYFYLMVVYLYVRKLKKKAKGM